MNEEEKVEGAVCINGHYITYEALGMGIAQIVRMSDTQLCTDDLILCKLPHLSGKPMTDQQLLKMREVIDWALDHNNEN